MPLSRPRSKHDSLLGPKVDDLALIKITQAIVGHSPTHHFPVEGLRYSVSGDEDTDQNKDAKRHANRTGLGIGLTISVSSSAFSKAPTKIRGFRVFWTAAELENHM